MIKNYPDESTDLLILLFLIITFVSITIGIEAFQKKRIKLSRVSFPESVMVYMNHKGAHKNLHHVLLSIHEDIKDCFKISKVFSIRVDSPDAISD